MKDVYRSQFRLPYDLYEQLKALAEKNRRPLNVELVYRLEIAVAEYKGKEHFMNLGMSEDDVRKERDFLEKAFPARKVGNENDVIQPTVRDELDAEIKKLGHEQALALLNLLKSLK